MKCDGKRRTRIRLLVKLAGLRLSVRTMLGMVTVVICRNAVNVKHNDFRETIMILLRPISMVLEAPLHNDMETKSFEVVTYIG